MTHPKIKDYEDYFLSKVEKTDSCWFWKTSKGKDKYGQFYCKIGTFPAHRFSYMLYKGDIPRGMFVCHNCPGGDTKACVNPDHLWIGTPSNNIRDSLDKKGILRPDDPNVIFLKIRIPYEIWKRMRLFCIEKDLSLPKLVSQLIESSCNSFEKNQEHIKIKD